MQLASGIGKLKMKRQWKADSNAPAAASGTRLRWTSPLGAIQSYVEDCQVCCKPNVLRVQYDTGEHEFVITAQLESL